MGMPATWKKGVYHAVFCYTSDLEKASKHLAVLLGCPHLRVVLGKGEFKKSYGSTPSLGDVAWLVGHGLRSDKQLGSLARGTYIESETVLDILVGEGYKTVVDTGCQPDLRRTVAAEYPLDYYGTLDGRDVNVILDYADVDSWWDDNHIALRTDALSQEDDF